MLTEHDFWGWGEGKEKRKEFKKIMNKKIRKNIISVLVGLWGECKCP